MLINEKGEVEEGEQRKNRCLVVGTNEGRKEDMVIKDRPRQKVRTKGTGKQRKRKEEITQIAHKVKSFGGSLIAATRDQ